MRCNRGRSSSEVGITCRVDSQIGILCDLRAGATGSGVEQVEELAWGEDWRVGLGEFEEVPVAGDEVVRSGGEGERDQVVIVGIRGDTGRVGRVGDDDGVGGEAGDERDRDGGGDEPFELRAGEDVGELVEHGGADDQVEAFVGPGGEDLSWWTGR